ncbi:DUF3300 domain-containing protein [Ralstonia sp. ASV6]|uniref:DUF3300 domain-containing protein n=1 Tax=Ralstonia sp. ASV6 TaxID=2795124 RepID=UPI0018EDC042|nr:DUF3300 domain-containing protein [Ralstonia sp. ASV6]
MNARSVKPLAVALALVLLLFNVAFSQPGVLVSDPPLASAEQLDPLLAPIALYPDPLVSQILMAATYPLEVVQADRWLQEPSHAALGGDSLTNALAPLPWDPSVKSLVPFPGLLRMMDDNLDWTERVGNAFLADEAAVMDSIQRLRSHAAAAGTLASTTQAMVSTEDGAITIEPTNPEVVYVPVYDPYVVYAPWPYPAYPPYLFPDIWGGVVIGGLGIGWVGFSVVVPLWGWDHVNWHGHRIDIDRGRFGNIDHHRAPISGIWAHDPGHRHGVPYPSAIPAGRFGGAAISPDVRRGFQGYPMPSATPAGSVIRPSPVGPARPALDAPRSSPRQAPTARPAARAPSPSYPPTFESYGHGADVRGQAQRGQASRMSAAPQTSAPSFRGAAPHAAPAGGGRRR